MTKQKIFPRLTLSRFFALTLLGLLYIGFICLLVTWTASPPDRTPEQVFSARLLDEQPLAVAVSNIQALETGAGFRYSTGLTQ